LYYGKDLPKKVAYPQPCPQKLESRRGGRNGHLKVGSEWTDGAKNTQGRKTALKLDTGR